MNLKEKMKRFWNLNRHHAEGFTLVELIVVIAILAILAGVAVPVYSTYITQANKQADRTLAADVANALQLYFYNHMDEFSGVTAVILTPDGGKVGDSDSFAAQALIAAYGTNWPDSLKLKYNKWGAGAEMAQKALAQFVRVAGDSSNVLSGIYDGTLEPSFSGEVDELFTDIRDISMEIGKALGKGGAELVDGAAGMTVTNTNVPDASTFAGYWATPGAWGNYFMQSGDEGKYNGDVNDLSNEALNCAIANSAVVKARNVALANYLRNAGYSEVYDMIYNYSYAGSSVPRDVMTMSGGTYDAPDDDFAKKFELALGYDSTDPTSNSDRYNACLDTMIAYFTDGDARNDALAYYAMMSSVNELNADKTFTQADDATYWDEMAGAVSLYGSIARGEVDLYQLNDIYTALGAADPNSVVVTMMYANGELTININPLTANTSN